MIRSSFAAAIAATLAAGPSAVHPAFGQDDNDQQFGNVHFPTSCNETAQRRFDRGMRYQHSFWYRASKEIFEEALKADPECAIAYWGIALSLLYNPHSRAAGGNLPLGLAALQKAKAIGAKTQRERDYIDALLVFYTDYDKVAHGARVQAYLKAMEALAQRYPGRRRSADRLCHHAERRGLAQRQDLCQPAQGCRHPGADLQAPAAASRRRPLSDPPLRLPADRRERARRGQALCRDRAGGAARPAHAVAHLHARRLLEGIDRVQHRLGARGEGRQGVHDQLHAMDYHGLRLSAARPGQARRATSSTR